MTQNQDQRTERRPIVIVENLPGWCEAVIRAERLRLRALRTAEGSWLRQEVAHFERLAK